MLGMGCKKVEKDPENERLCLVPIGQGSMKSKGQCCCHAAGKANVISNPESGEHKNPLFPFNPFVRFFFRFFITFSGVDSVATALLNITTPLPTTLRTPLLTLLVLLTVSPLLHSLGHGTRLVIPSPVQNFAAPI
ncbi:hypothetical protein [Absidia glauca]|uniref:Ndc10 domain-containing protein n=1 Tax=Absidia glauca TaxID=4829 RepID=A0A163KVJ3_ABSGL|nr:hypothetical protein [Absidia glauca]